ncbi:pentapeptide repeat-containing protein [Streptomyces sp. t39]|uniref:pentapeptide repeat-containing protein n=1 Tax=Streptomyces sp. t39 TaxID=1828156 RepID=UPI0011CDFD74|nr:pentapeptide repeat-containing protein [Streptomyces sp. t39]TXS52751.1 pentapeptide repeat-containing protein [Streptomyces sp. t39]
MRLQIARRQAGRRGLRLWNVGVVLALAFTAALLVAGFVFNTGWDLLGAKKLKTQSEIDSKTLFDLVKLSFGVVAGAGALVALVVAYRRQRVDEDGALRDATRLHTERFTAAVSQLGDESAAVRLGGVHALAGLADDAPTRELRQTCVDVLCAYLRLPYTPQADLLPNDTEAQHAYLSLREVRHTVIRLIRDHLRLPTDHQHSWGELHLDFTGVVFDGGDFSGAKFSGGTVSFSGAVFSGGTVSFSGAVFSGARVDFGGAKFSGARVDFGGAKFSGGWVDFDVAKFSGRWVDFGGAKFSGARVDFSSAKFSGARVDFAAAVFSGGTVRFSGVVSSGGRVSFVGAKFSGARVDFITAAFSGGAVDFGRAVFSGGAVDFGRAVFSGGAVDFGGATFSNNTVNFSGATFSGGTVDLSRVSGAAPHGLPSSPPAGLLLPTP